MFFVPERRQSRRAQRRDPRRASLASEAISTVPPMGFEPMLERV